MASIPGKILYHEIIDCLEESTSSWYDILPWCFQKGSTFQKDCLLMHQMM